MNDYIDTLIRLETAIEAESFSEEKMESIRYHLAALEALLWPHYS